MGIFFLDLWIDGLNSLLWLAKRQFVEIWQLVAFLSFILVYQMIFSLATERTWLRLSVWLQWFSPGLGQYFPCYLYEYVCHWTSCNITIALHNVGVLLPQPLISWGRTTLILQSQASDPFDHIHIWQVSPQPSWHLPAMNMAFHKLYKTMFRCFRKR